ncbi:unnamed protein product, partial [Didymodactylos carnosus]
SYLRHQLSSKRYFTEHHSNAVTPEASTLSLKDHAPKLSPITPSKNDLIHFARVRTINYELTSWHVLLQLLLNNYDQLSLSTSSNRSLIAVQTTHMCLEHLKSTITTDIFFLPHYIDRNCNIFPLGQYIINDSKYKRVLLELIESCQRLYATSLNEKT